jgi:hypothetical protein
MMALVEVVSQVILVFIVGEKAYLPSVGEVWFDCGEDAWACCASRSTLLGESLNEGFFLCDLDLVARCFEKLPS